MCAFLLKCVLLVYVCVEGFTKNFVDCSMINRLFIETWNRIEGVPWYGVMVRL